MAIQLLDWWLTGCLNFESWPHPLDRRLSRGTAGREFIHSLFIKVTFLFPPPAASSAQKYCFRSRAIHLHHFGAEIDADFADILLDLLFPRRNECHDAVARSPGIFYNCSPRLAFQRHVFADFIIENYFANFRLIYMLKQLILWLFHRWHTWTFDFSAFLKNTSFCGLVF